MTDLSRRHLVGLLGAGALVSGAAVAIPVGDATLPLPPTRGRGVPTRFGTVEVLGTRRHRGAAATVGHAQHGAGGNRSWPDLVVVDLEVHNGTDKSLLLAAGQFRLRVGSDGPTVTPYASNRGARPVPAHQTVRTWVSYLAPEDAADLRLEFKDVFAGELLEMPLAATDGDAAAQAHDHEEVGS